jgi:hypothetical protein
LKVQGWLSTSEVLNRKLITIASRDVFHENITIYCIRLSLQVKNKAISKEKIIG